jgi:hypothetical protein
MEDPNQPTITEDPAEAAAEGVQGIRIGSSAEELA